MFAFLKLICGLAFFLFGMKVMSGSLEKMAGGKLEKSLRKATKNPFISMGLGAIITIAMQSSSATTVMLVGLVNSGIMAFSDTLYVIFGANIGTTLTSWIISLSGINSDNVFIQMLKPVNFSPIIAFIGILFIMLSDSDRKKSIGNVFVGFTVLMYGMEFMSNAVSPLADSAWFKESIVGLNNPIIGVLIGTVFTGIIQSSAAALAVLQALSMSGLITYGMTVPLVMGINIGTCATALISCIGTSCSARRVATVHVSIKIIGTVICLSVFAALNAIFNFAFVNTAVNQTGIAFVHTAFNIAITIILMPFKNQLVALTKLIVRRKGEQRATENAPAVIDQRVLRAPSVAVIECENSSVKMCKIAENNLILALDLFGDYNKENAELIVENEELLDAYEDALGSSLVKISSEAISDKDSRKVSKMLHAIGDFERLGDHALNLLKAVNEIREKKIRFSPEAETEMAVLISAIRKIVQLTVDAYCSNSLDTAARVEPLEQVIDKLAASIRDNHIGRLQKGNCTIETGFVLSDMLTNFERISDHCSNIAVAVIEVEHDSFDTHKYLNGVKYGNNEFNMIYDEYEKEYAL